MNRQNIPKLDIFVIIKRLIRRPTFLLSRSTHSFHNIQDISKLMLICGVGQDINMTALIRAEHLLTFNSRHGVVCVSIVRMIREIVRVGVKLLKVKWGSLFILSVEFEILMDILRNHNLTITNCLM